jgi:hypothetical protein
MKQLQLFCCLFFLQFCILDKGFASAVDIQAKCGFSNKDELLKTAKDITASFSNLKAANLTLGVLSSTEFSSTPPTNEASEVVNLSLSKISVSPILAVPVSNKLLNVLYNDGNGQCGGLPCAWPNTFTIILPGIWLNQMKAKFGENFDGMILVILGHEIGHHVYNAIFRADPQYPRVNANGPLTPLKYHLTVDAIGSILTGVSLDEVTKVLKATATSGAFEGDGQDRLTCLTELP